MNETQTLPPSLINFWTFWKAQYLVVYRSSEAIRMNGVKTRLVRGNVIPMGIPLETSHGMGRDRHKLLWEGNGQINMSHGQPWLEPNFVFQVHASLFRSQWSVAKVEMFFVAFLRRRCQNGHFYAKSEACFFHQPFSSACCGNAGDAKVKLCDDLVKLYVKSCCYWLYLFAWKRFGGVMATYYRCSFLEFSSFRKMIGLIIVVRRILRGTVHWYGRPLRRNYDLYSVWIVFEIRALAEDRPRRQLFATEFLAHCCRFLPELTLGKIACFSQNGSFFCKIARFFAK